MTQLQINYNWKWKFQVTFIAQWNTWYKKNENKTQKAHVNWKSKILSFMHEQGIVVAYTLKQAKCNIYTVMGHM